jgi:hypothetical protein
MISKYCFFDVSNLITNLNCNNALSANRLRFALTKNSVHLCQSVIQMISLSTSLHANVRCPVGVAVAVAVAFDFYFDFCSLTGKRTQHRKTSSNCIRFCVLPEYRNISMFYLISAGQIIKSILKRYFDVLPSFPP